MKHKSPATKSVEWMQQILPPYQWMTEQSKCMSQRPANKLIKPSRRRIKTHNPIFWLQKGSVNNKVWWSAKIWLDIHAPFSRIHMKSNRNSLTTQGLNLINVLITSWLFGLFIANNFDRSNLLLSSLIACYDRAPIVLLVASLYAAWWLRFISFICWVESHVHRDMKLNNRKWRSVSSFEYFICWKVSTRHFFHELTFPHHMMECSECYILHVCLPNLCAPHSQIP